MDSIDIVTEQELYLETIAIENARRSIPSGQSLPFCEDCDAPIPKARRLAVPGCTRCVDCQAEVEALRC